MLKRRLTAVQNTNRQLTWSQQLNSLNYFTPCFRSAQNKGELIGYMYPNIFLKIAAFRGQKHHFWRFQIKLKFQNFKIFPDPETRWEINSRGIVIQGIPLVPFSKRIFHSPVGNIKATARVVNHPKTHYFL